MFDIGFSELVLLMLVGLVVLGPKRLPVAIRTVMGWVKTIRGLAANVQNELETESQQGYPGIELTFQNLHLL